MTLTQQEGISDLLPVLLLQNLPLLALLPEPTWPGPPAHPGSEHLQQVAPIPGTWVMSQRTPDSSVTMEGMLQHMTPWALYDLKALNLLLYPA